MAAAWLLCAPTSPSTTSRGKRPAIRAALEDQIPIGGPGVKGSWEEKHGTPQRVFRVWEKEFDDGYARILAKHPKLNEKPTWSQLGTLGTGNHFIEVCQDLGDGGVWLMLHSGSRGVGNRIGTYFIEAAKAQALTLDRTVKTDLNLAWLDEGTVAFADYMEAIGWAQRYARRKAAAAVSGENRLTWARESLQPSR